MTYVMEHEDESNRLERQAKLPNYLLSMEFKDLVIPPDTRVLDAGCGSGVISRYLVNRFDNIQLDACDFSEIRLKQAENLCTSSVEKKINFFKSDLSEITISDKSYDFIVCRFVLEHLHNPLKAVQEFYRLLKSGGTACLVDLDGILFNLYTLNEELNKMLGLLRTGWKTDLFIGRKIPNLMKQAGFSNLSWSIKTLIFKQKDLDEELWLTEQRLKFCRPLILDILGSERSVDRFIHLYCQEMIKEENTLFYNNFIVYGQKLERL